MRSPLLNFAAERAAKRIPYLRRLPVARLLALGEVVLLAKAHAELLTPAERRRLVLLLREARGRPGRLNPAQRNELEALIAKAQPRLFVGEAAQRLSPVPLPKRIVRGPKRRQRTV
jgi:hypothetical protein